MAEPVNVLASELHTLTSTRTGRDYRIMVSLPLGYMAKPDEPWPFNNMPAQWPVVYVPDGNWYFGMVTGMIRTMAWCGSTTDAIVVGIGYAEDDGTLDAFRASFTRRDHDLTPIVDKEVEQGMSEHHRLPAPNGDAAGFHHFIQNDLIPFIETTYRADPARRILAGHSYGGLFALFSLFETPDLFSNLIIGSPTLSYGNYFMNQREADFAKEPKPIPATIYLFAGELEEGIDNKTLTDTMRLGATLKGRSYEGLALVQHIFLDQNHCEVVAPGFQWGLKHALKG